MSRTKPVIIVSGLPRSGTSMMMQMLQAGGIPVVYDKKRPADKHNPYGYFELEKVKKLEQDNSWIKNCTGKTVKILFHLLKYLPETTQYKIIFMQRDLNDVIASQDKMLESYTKTVHGDRAKVITLFEKERNHIISWLEEKKNMDVLYVEYSDVLARNNEVLLQLSEFLGARLDIKSMQLAVNPVIPAKT
jgi:hypothetical protein